MVGWAARRGRSPLEFGCRVTVIDLTESYVEAGRMLTALVGLDDRVDFLVGDALALPFDDGAFDAVWTQNSGMNIADKARPVRRLPPSRPARTAGS